MAVISHSDRRVKILQVLWGTSLGGIEVWLMNVLRTIDRERYQLDFGVEVDTNGHFDREIRMLGSNIVVLGPAANPFRFWEQLRKVVAETGPYDGVHAHFRLSTSGVLWAAKKAGIPLRIAHSHNDQRRQEGLLPFRRRAVASAAKWAIRRYCTHGLATSRKAAEDLYGLAWPCDGRFRVLHCGIDPSDFETNVERENIRRSLSIPPSAKVIGHVGRVVYEKNHSFLLEVAARVIARNAATYVLLVGAGNMMLATREKAARLGIADNVIFAGPRPDVARLMLGAMDVLLFPSVNEGLGMAVVEAQAAGLPCVVSEAVSDEAAIIPSLLRKLPLDAPIETWVAAVHETMGTSRFPRDRALALFRRSNFDIRRCVAALCAIYDCARDSEVAGSTLVSARRTLRRGHPSDQSR